MARILFPTGKVGIGKSAIAVATPVRDAEPSFTSQATEGTRRAKKRGLPKTEGVYTRLRTKRKTMSLKRNSFIIKVMKQQLLFSS